MFQLIYLRFTQPRADPAAFAALASQARALLANRDASPDVVFDQTLDAALSRNSPRRQPETRGDGGPVEPRRSRWRSTRRASRTRANFTFVFVGSFTPETIKPLVETYIASLPATHARETLARPRHHAADGRRREDDRDGHRAEEPGGDRLLGSVRVRRSAHPGAADDDAAAAVAAVRHHPAGARRHLQHHRRRRAREGSRGRNTACASSGPAIPRARGAGAARVRGDRERQGDATSRASGWAGSATRCCASTSTTARRTATCSTRSRATTRTADGARRSARCRTRSAR